MASASNIILVFATTVVAYGYTTTSDCFILQGKYTNGTNLGFLNVGDHNFGISAALVRNSSLATKLGIDSGTRSMIDHNEGNILPRLPHNGLIAAVNWDGDYNDNIYFETSGDLQDQEIAENIALNCRLSFSNTLACVHPKKANYDVFQLCTKYGNSLEIGSEINLDRDCQSVVLSATATRGCKPPTTTATISPSPTQTITTLPTSTSMPPRRNLCTQTGTVCADNFLVKCSKLPYNTTIEWYWANSIDGPFGGLYSQTLCHQACVNDAACGGWRYYEEEIDLINCLHTHDTIPSDVQFRFEYYFYSVGVRGACQ
jgi:hypothetical protein